MRQQKRPRTHLVVERLDLLLALALTDLVRVCDSKELRCGLDEPFRLYRQDVVAVLTRGEYEFVVDAPFGRAVEERTRGMYVYGRALDERLVSLLRVLLRRVPE